MSTGLLNAGKPKVSLVYEPQQSCYEWHTNLPHAFFFSFLTQNCSTGLDEDGFALVLTYSLSKSALISLGHESGGCRRGSSISLRCVSSCFTEWSPGLCGPVCRGMGQIVPPRCVPSEWAEPPAAEGTTALPLQFIPLPSWELIPSAARGRRIVNGKLCCPLYMSTWILSLMTLDCLSDFH